MQMFYLGLAIFGTAVPYAAFVPWLLEYGINVPQFFAEIMANPISIFAWLDVALAAVALLVFILHDGQKNQIKWRSIAIIGTLGVGVSCGLPLYLYLRERQQGENQLNRTQ